MTRRAVLGTDVSIVWEAVRLANCSRRGVRDSNGKRTARGPRLFHVRDQQDKRGIVLSTNHLRAWFCTSPC